MSSNLATISTSHMPFSIGDVVKLKSGSPPLVIFAFEKGEVCALWMSERDVFQIQVPPATLIKVGDAAVARLGAGE